MSTKNSSGTIGNRTRDPPVCSAVPQLTAQPRAPILHCSWENKRDAVLSDTYQAIISHTPENTKILKSTFLVKRPRYFISHKIFTFSVFHTRAQRSAVVTVVMSVVRGEL